MASFDGNTGLDEFVYKPTPYRPGVWIAATVVLLAAVGVVLYALSFDATSYTTADRPSPRITAAPTPSMTPLALAPTPKT